MTTPLQPGVFVNVTQSPLAQSVNTIPGAGAAAFALNYNIGPTQPMLVGSWQQFVNLFGSFAQSAGSLLHYAVYQFFNNGGNSCYVMRVANTDATAGSLTFQDISSPTPAAPILQTATTGGTVLAGTYKVQVTYTNTTGETLPSPVTTITTTGSTSTITIPSPVQYGNATGWYAYVSQAGGNTLTRQQSLGSPTAIGTNLVLTAPPSSGGNNPPVTDTSTDPVLTVTSKYPGAFANTVYVALTSAGGTTGRFNLNVYVGGSTQGFQRESFPSLSVNPADQRYVASVVNSPYSGSQYVTVSVNIPSTGYVQGQTDPTLVAATALTGGADGVVAPTLSTAVSAGLDTIQNQILYVNLPGVTSNTTINGLLTWADGRGDVMLVVDGPSPTTGETSSQVATNYTSMVNGSNVINADANATIYAPWLGILDPASLATGAMRYVPPGGAVLGVWQKGQSRYGVQQAPAGTWATVNAQALEVNFTATDLQNLNVAQVNAIKRMPNIGYCIFGARTLATGLPSRYVNVQRTLIKLTHDMQNLLAFATFQPNGQPLWDAVSTVLTTYLLQQMQDGLLAGSTPSTAFTVVCDSTINTPTTAQSGVVNINVGVALLSPAEFIIINLQQLSASATPTQ